MITFDIIRGHKLILWSDRLNFQEEFVEQLDKFGTNYVSAIEQVDTDAYSLIVLAKLKNQSAPFSIIFTCNKLQLDSLVEKVQIEGET